LGPTLTAQGSDTDISPQYAAKGIGSHLFRANGTGGSVILELSSGGSTSIVNGVRIYGGATGVNPVIQAVGNDTNLDLVITGRGTGGVTFQSMSSGYNQFKIATTYGAVNYFSTTGANTGNAVTLTSVGSDTNVNMACTTQGSGSFSFLNSNATNGIVFSKNIPINEWTITANNTSNLGLAATGGGAIYFYTSTGGSLRQLAISSTSSAVNYLNVTGSTTGNNPTLSAQGSDAAVGMNFIALFHEF
jgi:hypothetical protein